ncbi:asparagine synthase-related protein [Streptomyces sp. NPDC005970]|uniref:asparagine synthase-related protein n=1 Tax=Streptomyces sp. NPDC005970 TaxID=3156723 RepID=UPI0033F78DAB
MWFFVVFPDSARASQVAERFDKATHQVLRYPSGRPMLIARTHPAQIVTAEAGPLRGAVIGCSSATEDELRHGLDRAGDVRDLDTFAHRLAGSFHLVATDGDRLRVQGSASGLRRVFHAVVDGVTIASDRADVLADLGEFGFNEVTLALRLLQTLPHPLREEPLWRGVTPVEPERYLLLADGSSRTVPWWRRPEPVLSLAEGATAFRTALEAAVSVRTRDGGRVYCDLSGGLDSTPLCYLAAQGPAEILAVTGYNDDPGGGEDLLWARRALPSMPQVRHTTHSTDDMPQFFDGMVDFTVRLDEPTQAYLASPRVEHIVREAAGRGARLCVNGLGGDHLLQGRPVWDHTIFRRHPWLGWRRARTYGLLMGRPMTPVVRELLTAESYRRWFRRMAGDMRFGRGERSPVTLEWDFPIKLPRWLTRHAITLISRRVAEVAEEVVPLGPDRARHDELNVVRGGTNLVRGAQQFAASLGVPYEAPFFDDRVVEAAFAVRHEERATPMEFKPLMKAAMRNALPADFLSRTTKTNGTTQGVRGLRDHWPYLRDLCAQSLLVELDILDMTALADSLRPEQMRAEDYFLDTTLNTVVFLRTHNRHARREGERRDAVT